MQVLALYSGVLGMLLIYLSYNVAGSRKKFKVGIGDGENKDLARAIRVHANFTEYVPIALILLAVYEANQGHVMVTHIAGITLVIGRLLHAYGLGKTVRTSFGRLVGILLTWLVIVGLSIANIYYFIVATG